MKTGGHMRRKIPVIMFVLPIMLFIAGCATTTEMTQSGRSGILQDTGFATEVKNLWLTQDVKNKKDFFTTDEPEITYYAIFQNLTNVNLFQAKIYTIEWYAPSGERYFVDQVATSYGNNNLVYSKLKLKDTEAQEKLGKWHCKFYRSGILMDERSFILESPGVREKRLAALKQLQEEKQIADIKETIDEQKGIVYDMHTPQKLTKIVEQNNNFVALLILVNEQKEIIGSGSGFLVDKNGLLATNYHVIKDAKGGVVKFPDKNLYVIESIEAINPKKDLALIKIDYKNDAYVKMGYSDILKPGDGIVAIGSPFALANSVSEGIVSGIRNIAEGDKRIQISAPISPGSSGGPLFNLSGEVVGVTSSGYVGGGAQNINFAIPIEYVKDLMKNINKSPLIIYSDLLDKFWGYQNFKQEKK